MSAQISDPDENGMRTVTVDCPCVDNLVATGEWDPNCDHKQTTYMISDAEFRSNK